MIFPCGAVGAMAPVTPEVTWCSWRSFSISGDRFAIPEVVLECFKEGRCLRPAPAEVAGSGWLRQRLLAWDCFLGSSSLEPALMEVACKGLI